MNKYQKLDKLEIRPTVEISKLPESTTQKYNQLEIKNVQEIRPTTRNRPTTY
jgi:hypothetical protein